MFVVGVRAPLTPTQAVSPDDVTDLIEILVESLDDLGFAQADVSSVIEHGKVIVTVEVIVTTEDPMRALEIGFAAVRKAFSEAGAMGPDDPDQVITDGRSVVRDGWGMSGEIESSTRLLVSA